jgi:3'-phosphoadenosine 5'-phosphosulfate sulfotransferase (PAPS reductase)/FAD synthetase
MPTWKNERINWKGKREFWLKSDYANMSNSERRGFLKREGIEYSDVPVCKDCQHSYHTCVCDNKKYHEKIEARKKLFALSFDDKLKFSQELVEKILRENGGKKIYIAYSGGIDSECCVQLFKDAIIDGRVQIIWGDTLVEFSDTRNRIQELEKEFGIKIIRATPERGISFRTVVQKYGLPLYSRASASKEKSIATLKCCYLLKKKPMKQITKHYDVAVLGLRLEENMYRSSLIYSRGSYFYSKTHKMFRAYPIAYWTIEDVWKFQRFNGFHFNKIYANTNCNKMGFYKLNSGTFYQIRTGCWSCPQARQSGYLEWLQNYYPRFFNAIMQNYGLEKIIREEGIDIGGKGETPYLKMKEYILLNPSKKTTEALKELNLDYAIHHKVFSSLKHRLKIEKKEANLKLITEKKQKLKEKEFVPCGEPL